MVTMQVSVSENVQQAFCARFAPEERDQVMELLMRQATQLSPYDAASLAEDEQRYQRYAASGNGLSTAEVIDKLKEQRSTARR